LSPRKDGATAMNYARPSRRMTPGG
jgi:hypothetical protein